MNTETQPQQRLYYMDNIRAIAMLLGILLHGVMAYSPTFQNLWLMTNEDTSPLMDVVFFFVHLFRMGLFFLIAGYFAHLLINKRGIVGFIKNRTLRIAVPFIIFLTALTYIIGKIIVYALTELNFVPPLLVLLSKAPAAEGFSLPNMWHLWFLYSLFAFCIIAAVLSKVSGTLISRSIDKLFSSPLTLLFIPLLLVPGLLLATLPVGSPKAYIPQLWNLLHYGAIFAFGWALFRNMKWLDQIAKFAPVMLVAGLVGYAVFYISLPEITLGVMTGKAPQAKTLSHVLTVVLEAYVMVFLILSLLIFGKKFLDTNNAVMRYMANSSYWVYIAHFPVLIALQAVTADWGISLWFKFAFNLTATAAICLISYQLLIKPTPIGWLLNGRKTLAKPVNA